MKYRLIVDGNVPDEWAEWFSAEVTRIGGNTILDVAVTDQSALHGILKRVHVLHLKLISLHELNDK